MKIVITGADGFLGWHLRCRLLALTDHEVVAVGRTTFPNLPKLVADADAVIHLAGANRATDSELLRGNVGLAETVAKVVRSSGAKPRVIYANSVHAGDGTPYGDGKAGASDVLASAATEVGATYVDVSLPNLFGEHGRPGYNSFVATFCHAVAHGRTPEVVDNVVPLLHVQAAAQALIDALDGPSRVNSPAGDLHGVVEVLDRITSFAETYSTGEIPVLDSDFAVDLFNTYRASAFLSRGPIEFGRKTDARGSLVEAIKVHGGGGQAFFSTTVPGVTRGEHFHLRKIERFVVMSGRATIRLRRLYDSEVTSFEVTGDRPMAIDMPTMWAHNITNTGKDELLTLFWTNTVFDPASPDTFPELVDARAEGHA